MKSFTPFMNRCLAVLLPLACISITIASQAAEQKLPNVLFVFADDFRADAISALGNRTVKTPTLDSLVKRGLAFRNAYCLGANVGAVCTPSRNMLLSGRSYFRWSGPMAPGNPPNFPLSMQARGYETYHHGKKGNSAMAIQATFEINKYLKNDLEDRADGEPGRSIVDEAISFISTRKKDRPFFMYLAFANPHDPRVAATKYMEMYKREEIRPPKNFRPVHLFDNGEMTIRDELLAPWPRTEEDICRHLHEYYAVISGLDHHIGRLLAAVRNQGLYDNTLVVFSADQGLAIGSHGLMGKQNLYDASMKVPLIFAGPGIKHGQSEALVYLLDVYPTICDLVGGQGPKGLDGSSFAPVLKGKSDKHREALFLAYRHVQRAIRDEEWKLIRYPQINRSQLFNLDRDPDELNDLSGDPRQAKRINSMLHRLQDLCARFGDTQSLSSRNPLPPEFVPPTGKVLENMLRTHKIPESTRNPTKR